MTDATQGAPAAEAGKTEEATGQFGGFNTVEELAAAYAATQKTAEPAKTEELIIKPDKEGDGEGTDDEVADALKSAGLDQTVFTKEFAETGDLSEESKAALEAKGFPRAMVDVYLRGLRADQAEYESTIYSPAGGKDGYKALIEWAGKNLADADIDAFNAAITSGNAAQAKLAVAGLVTARGNGKAPVLLNGKGGPTNEGVQPYESMAQARSAVNDPRYRSDPAYRRAHEARLMVSKF